MEGQQQAQSQRLPEWVHDWVSSPTPTVASLLASLWEAVNDGSRVYLPATWETQSEFQALSCAQPGCCRECTKRWKYSLSALLMRGNMDIENKFNLKIVRNDQTYLRKIQLDERDDDWTLEQNKEKVEV